MSTAVLLCLAAAAAAAQPECAGVGSVRGHADLQPRCSAEGRTFQRTPAALLPDDHRFVGMETVQRLRRDVQRLSRRRQRTRKRRWVGSVVCSGGACDQPADRQCCQPSTEVIVPLSAASSVTGQRVQIVQAPPRRLQPVLVGRCPGRRCPLTNITCHQLYTPQMLIKLSGRQLHLDLVYVEAGCQCLPEATGLLANHTGDLRDPGPSGLEEERQQSSSSTAASDRLKYVLEDQLFAAGTADPADGSRADSAEISTQPRSQARNNAGDWELEEGSTSDDVGEDERDKRENDTVVLVHTAGDDWEFVIQRLHGEESKQGRSSSESTKQAVQTPATTETTARLQPVPEGNADSNFSLPSVSSTVETPDETNTAHTGQSERHTDTYTTPPVITTSPAIPLTTIPGSRPLSHPTHPVTSQKTSVGSMSTSGTRSTSTSSFEDVLYDNNLIPSTNAATFDPMTVTGSGVIPEDSSSGVGGTELHISQKAAISVPSYEDEATELLRTYKEKEPPTAAVTVSLQGKTTHTVDDFPVSEPARGVEKLPTDLPIAHSSLESEVQGPYTDQPSQLEAENQLRAANVSVLGNENGPGVQAVSTSEPSSATDLPATVAKKPTYEESVGETTSAGDVPVKPDLSVLSPESTATVETPSVGSGESMSEDESYDEAEASRVTTAFANLMASTSSGSASEDHLSSSGTVAIYALEKEESSAHRTNRVAVTVSDIVRSVTMPVESSEYEANVEKTETGNVSAKPALAAVLTTLESRPEDKQPQRGDMVPLPRPSTTSPGATPCITLAAAPTPVPSPPPAGIVSTRSKQQQHSHNLTQALEFLSQTIANVRRQEVEALSGDLSADHWRLVRLVASSYALGSEACSWARSDTAPLPTTTKLPTTTRAAITADAPLQSAVSLIVEAMERERRALEEMYDRRLEALDELISEKQQAVRSTFERELELLKSILQSLGLPERHTTEVDAAAKVDAEKVTCGEAPLTPCRETTEPVAQENVVSGSAALTPGIQNDASQIFGVAKAAPGLECGLVEEENAEEKIIEQLDEFTSVIFGIGVEFYNAFRPEEPGQRSMRMAQIRPRTPSPGEKLTRLLRQIAGSYGRFSFAFEDAAIHIGNLEQMTTLLAGSIGLEPQSDPVKSLYGLPEAISNLLRCFIRDLEGFRLEAVVMDNFETTALEPMQALSGPGTGELTQALTIRLTSLYSRVWSIWRFMFNSFVRPTTSVELRVEQNLRVVHLNREELRLLVDGTVSILLPDERAELASAQQALASAAEPLQFAVSELRELARLLVDAAELLLTSDAGERQRRQVAQVGPPAVVRQMAVAVLDGLDCFVVALADPEAASAEFDAAVRPPPSADATEASTPPLDNLPPTTALATVFPPECELIEEQNAEELIIDQLDDFTELLFDIGVEFFNAFRPEEPIARHSQRASSLQSRASLTPRSRLFRLLRQIAGSVGRFQFALEDVEVQLGDLEQVTLLLGNGLGLPPQPGPAATAEGLPEAMTALLRCFLDDVDGFLLVDMLADNFNASLIEPLAQLSTPGTGGVTRALTIRLTSLFSRVWSIWRFMFNSFVRPTTSVELRVEENLRVVHLNREELRLLVDGTVSALLPDERAELASAQQALASAAEPLQFAVSELRELARLLVNAAELLLTSDAGERQRRQVAQVGPPAVVRQMAAAVLDGLDCFVVALADPEAASAEFDAAVRPPPSADATEASTPPLDDLPPTTALATVFPPECELIEEQNAEELIIDQLDDFTELLFGIGVEFFNAFRPEEPIARHSQRASSLQSRASLTPRSRLFRLLRQIAGSVGRFQFALEDVEVQLGDLEQVTLLLGNGLGLPPQPGPAATAEGLPEAMTALLRCFLDDVDGFLLVDMLADNFNASLIEPLAQLSTPGTGGVTRALTIRLTSLFSRVWSIWRFMFNSFVRPATSVELRVEENLRVVHLNREELRLLVDGTVSALLPDERAELASAQQALASAAEPLQFAVSELRELVRLLVDAAELLLTSDAGERQRRQVAQVEPPAVVRQMAAAVLDGLDCFVMALADPEAASAEFDAAVRPPPSADAAETDTTEPPHLATSTGLSQGVTSRKTTPEITDTGLTTPGTTATGSLKTYKPINDTALPPQSSASAAKPTMAFDTFFQSSSDITVPDEVASVKMTSASLLTAATNPEQNESSENELASSGLPTTSSGETNPPEGDKTRSTREIATSTGSSSILADTISTQGVPTVFQSTLFTEGSDASPGADISTSSVTTFSTSHSGTSAVYMMTENLMTEGFPQQETPVSSSVGSIDMSTETVMSAEAAEASTLHPDTTLYTPGKPGDTPTPENLSSAPEGGTAYGDPTPTPVTSQQKPPTPPSVPFLSEEDEEMIEELLGL